VTSRIDTPVPEIIRQIQRIQTVTICWMIIEAGVSLWAALRARSPALLAFGGDSAIELPSAVVVLWRFRRRISDERAEQRAAQIAGILLFVLAAFVVATAALTLLGYSEPKPSYVGIAVLCIAATIMPWLAREKRRLSAATARPSAPTRQNPCCALTCHSLP
jgi:divalent metal cation (Fe/Co/Zn/Cd) transporter